MLEVESSFINKEFKDIYLQVVLKSETEPLQSKIKCSLFRVYSYPDGLPCEAQVQISHTDINILLKIHSTATPDKYLSFIDDNKVKVIWNITDRCGFKLTESTTSNDLDIDGWEFDLKKQT
ncbi:hypothetical protein [Nodularia chucula]|uniref:hypothetical protein n=1 Tax=Nodularia chucula TaxID=3093667 RepID=UPI0039C6EC84